MDLYQAATIVDRCPVPRPRDRDRRSGRSPERRGSKAGRDPGRNGGDRTRPDHGEELDWEVEVKCGRQIEKDEHRRLACQRC
jgi:hypothetical protein